MIGILHLALVDYGAEWTHHDGKGRIALKAPSWFLGGYQINENMDSIIANALLGLS